MKKKINFCLFQDEIKALSQQFMLQLGSSEQGKIRKYKKMKYIKFSLGQVDRQQFIMGVQRCIAPNELEELLSFDIIPSKILDEANMLPSLQSSSTNLRGAYEYGNSDLVHDDQLRQIANQIAGRNWTKLALTLGFLEFDIEAYKLKNNNDPSATVCILFIL